MTDGEVAELFRTYADEPDQTFLTPAMVNRFCTIGFRKYRDKIAEINPSSIAVTQSYTLSNSDAINLLAATDQGNIIYGTVVSPDSGLDSIHSVYIKESSAVYPNTIFQAVYNYEELIHSTTPSYWWSGSNIKLSRRVTDTVTIRYLNILNNNFTVGSANWIDPFGKFHDLIALYACQQYAIMDGAANPMVEALIPQREEDIKKFFYRRANAGAQYVSDVTSTEFY
tara:strand:- start:127 stop:804 length:678 start_codon:yes stop_codon:yes gene_type:complete